MIKLQADGSIIKSYEWFSKARKIPKQQDYLQKDSFNRKAPWEQGLKLHKLPQQSLMFSFNYLMPAEIKMRNANRHYLYGAESRFNYTILERITIALTTPIQTQEQHLPYMHGFQEQIHSYPPTLAVTLASKAQGAILQR